MRYKTLTPSFRYTDDMGEYAVSRVFVACNAAARRAALRDRRRFVSFAEDSGFVATPGCRCRHCLNDWDCCGRMVPARARVTPARKGVVLTQHYSRNI